MPVVILVCAAVMLTVAPLLVLALWSRWRFTRRLPSFRCRVGPPSRTLRRGRWRLLRTRAAWVRDVLLVRSGFLHLGVTPVTVSVPRAGKVRQLGPGDVRGLGEHPVSLRCATDEGTAIEIAVAGPGVAELVGPFLTVLLPDPPTAPRDQDA